MNTIPPFPQETVDPPEGYLETLADRVIQRRKRQLRQRLVAGICALMVVGGWLSWSFFGLYQQGAEDNHFELQQQQMAQNTSGETSDTGEPLLKPADTIDFSQREPSINDPQDTSLTREQILDYLMDENFFDT